MKKTHILLLVVIAAGIGILITTAQDSSKYVSFSEAQALSTAGSKASIHVVGELKKGEDGQVLGILPGEDRVSFSFILVDENHQEQRVHYNQPMPMDFTKSEKVVVVGAFRKDDFLADKILLKCPSKYQEQNVEVASQ